MALKRNLIANYLGQGWAALMGLAFVPMYIKYLGIEAYGLIGLFAVLQAWLALLDMGMAPTLVREMARFTGKAHSNESIRDLLRSIELIALGVAVLIASGVAYGSDWIARSWLKADALPVEVVAQAFVIMGLVTALRFAEGVYRSAIVGLQRQILLNMVNIVMATLRGFGAVGVLTWLSPTIGAFFLWQAVVSIVTLAILAAATYSCIPKGCRGGRFSLVELRKVWRFAGGILGITLLSAILTQTDKIVLSAMLDLKSWGYYSFAATIAGSLSLLSLPIHQAWAPKLNEIFAERNKKKFVTYYHLGSQITTVVVGSISFVIIFYAELILLIWTKDASLSKATSEIVQVLVLGKMINSLMLVPSEVQLAYGWTSLGVFLNLVAIIFIVPCLLVFVPKFSSLGAAWIWVVLNIGYFVIAIPVMHSKVLRAEKWRWYFCDVIAPLLMSLIALLIFRVFFERSTMLYSNVLILIFATVVSFMASIIGASMLRVYIFNYVVSCIRIGRFL